MGRSISNSVFERLTSESTEFQHLIRVTGSVDDLGALKRHLTATNKSASYQLHKSKESLEFWERRASGERDVYGAVMPKTGRKIGELKAMIQKLSGEVKREFFHDEGSHLLVPSGLWFLTGTRIDDHHLNTEIKHCDIVKDKRFYQTEMVEEMLKFKRATGVLATGLGKTRCIAEIAVSAVKAGKRVFIVVPTEYLIKQMHGTIKPLHDSVTCAGGDWKPALGKDIFICTAQSAKKYIEPFDVILIDECQHSPATTWVDLITAADRAHHIYNFTATAFRSDGMDIGINAFGGPVVYERTVRWGIENGFLSPVDVYMKQFVFSVDAVKPRALATTAYSRLVGSIIPLTWLMGQLKDALDRDKKCIVLFKTVKMANKFKKICKGTVDFQVASGKFKKPLDQFCAGETTILVACDKLVAEGIDIPDADCLFMLTQNSSDVITYQSVGRVIRKAEGKEKAVVIDVSCVIKENPDPGGEDWGGFKQFNNARRKRLNTYYAITDNIKLLPDVAI